MLRFFKIVILFFLALPATLLMAQQGELLHYWNFNDTENLLEPSFTTGGASIDVLLAGGSELTFGDGQNFTGANARHDDGPGEHLRLNNPLNSILTISIPTTGQQNIVVKYETRRSGSGAGEQIIRYTTDGQNFTHFTTIAVLNGPSAVQTLDFSGIPEAGDNADFAILIEFGIGEGGDTGNNRFDNITVESFEELPELSIIHYWNFNNADDLITPAYSINDGNLEIQTGPITEILSGTGQDFYGANARFGDDAASHLRVNNPSGTVMLFSLPTTGYRYIRLNYETRRSGQGAGIQEISYTTDGDTFEPYTSLIIFDDVPVTRELNFSAIEEAGDNPDFAIMITFQQGEGGEAGNNRFDNITLEGDALGETNQPPVISQTVEPVITVALAEGTIIDLNDIFSDPDDDPLTFTAESSRESVANLQLNDGSSLSISPLYQGGANITISATDGINPPVVTSFRVLVYPGAHQLQSENGNGDIFHPYIFSEWSPEEPEGAFPPHMIFLQSEVDDPGLEDPLLFAYDIPEDDYHADDLEFLGYPYKLLRRTRINGLGEGGVAFINTGRGRDLGSAVVAVNTENSERVTVSWTGGTVLPNSRIYHIRLQARAGYEGEFTDVMSDGNPVEYIRNETGGHSIDFTPVELPEEMLGLPYVQLQWKYYYTGDRISEESGARDQLRISDIRIEATPQVSIDDEPSLARTISLDQNYPNPFNPSTSIRFEIPESGLVTLKIYSLLGREIATLANEMRPAGQHVIHFDGSALSSGVYFYELAAGNRRLTRRMLLLK